MGCWVYNSTSQEFVKYDMTEHGGNIAINGGFAAVFSEIFVERIGSTSLVGGGSRNRN